MTTKNILVAVPAYNCEMQIRRVVRQFVDAPRNIFPELVVIDNCSTDDTVSAAKNEISRWPDVKMNILRNQENYGLGGTHKVAFAYCLDQGFDGLVILHGDDQGNLSDFIPILSKINKGEYDCILGARFMRGSQLVGYPRLRVIGNYLFNWLYSVVTKVGIYDMGSGLNYFDRKGLADLMYLRMPDDLTFNNCYLLALIAARKEIHFEPIGWREEDQVSNAKLWTQSFKILKYLSIFVTNRSKLITSDLRDVNRANYQYSIVSSKG